MAMKITPNSLRETLAAQIGVEPEDINEDDSFTEDFHMTNADLTDFTFKLTEAGVDPLDIDFSETETLGELMEVLGVATATTDNG